MTQKIESYAAARSLPRYLSEELLGFLALVALGTALGPIVFDVSPATESLLNAIELVILVLFIVEFVLQWRNAVDRRSWLRSPWRIVDVLAIAGPVVSLLPQVSNSLRGALAFRLLRVGRALAFGARAGAVAVQQQRRLQTHTATGAAVLSVMRPDAQAVAQRASWSEYLAWTQERSPAWYHAAGASRDTFVRMAESASLSEPALRHLLDPAGQLRIQPFRGVTAVVISLPGAAASEPGSRVLALVSDRWVLTASPQDLDLQTVLAGLVPTQTVESVPFSARITYLLLTLARERFADVASAYVDQVRDLETVRLNKGGPEFLQKVFRLQREISAVSADLWRVKGIVRALADGKAGLPGVDAKNDVFLDNLATEFEGLCKEFDELKDALKTLMELHMNVRSFEMNEFMRLLAVVSFLGLIPSVVGGLLGMNVEGNPWPVTLGQVAFGVVMSMATSLYVFAIKGWLR